MRNSLFLRRLWRTAVLALGFGAAIGSAPAGAQPQRVDAVEVELVSREATAAPGRALEVGLRIRHDPHWHTYWRFPGDSGLPTTIDWRLPPGWSAGAIAWPTPERLLIGPLANYGYEGEVLLPVRLAVPRDAADGPAELVGQVQWLMCKDVCVPGEATVRLTVPVQARAAPAPTAHAPAFERARAQSAVEVQKASVSVSGRQVTFGFDRPASKAEFFPYRDGLVALSAPQVLGRVGGADSAQRRLSVDLPEAADPARHAEALADGKPLGVIVLDDRPFELVASVGPVGAAEAELGRAVGKVWSAGPAGGAGGLLGAGAPAAPSPPGNVSPDAVVSLGLAMLFGALGGLILNLMPCVFPVIGLKVMSFAGGGAADAGARARSRRSAIAFSVGVLASFLALASLLLALRAAGQSVGWGFQLQSPVFVTAMGLLFVLIALNFAGVFEIGVSLTRLGDREGALAAKQAGEGAGAWWGSFGSGVLAVLVATPCTAPFMGSALGFTLGQPALSVLLVFAAIALGMAAPYVLLGFVPALLRWLPRPGRWMESFRQFLSFPMFATAAWLAWVLGQQSGIDAVLALALGAVLLGLAAWLYGRFVQGAAGSTRRGWALGAAVVALGAAGWVAFQSPSTESAPAPASVGAGATAPVGSTAGWQPWSDAAVQQSLAAGRPVFVDFTAAWCVSCQVNKRVALDRDAVRLAFDKAGVVRLRADWTHRDPAITAALARHARNGVPLYLLYRPGQAQPQVLPELLTPGIVLQALGAS